MVITVVSILHHVAIVLVLLWGLAAFDWCHPIPYMLSLVHEGYTVRLRKKIQFEERKQANQKRVLSDSETVRWLNHAMEKIWPICMEHIILQQVLLPIIHWFPEKYKPWTSDKLLSIAFEETHVEPSCLSCSWMKVLAGGEEQII